MARLTKKKAKELSIEKWEWWVKHPTKDFEDMPLILQDKIKNYFAECPLCELYKRDEPCFKCPLYECNEHCGDIYSYYNLFCHIKDKKVLKALAKAILEIIKDWKV